MSACSCKTCSCGDCAESKEYQAFGGVDHIQEFEVVGVSSVISGNETGAQEINALWREFLGRQVGPKVEAREDDVIYAVYSDYEGDHTQPFRLTIGYKVAQDALKDLPDGFHRVEVKENDYALIATGGEQPRSLMEGWRTVWQSDLDRCFKTDFEVYGPKFFEEGVHEVLLAVGVNVDI